jgi:hypothetical protein
MRRQRLPAASDSATKLRHLLVRLMAVHAVQVDMILDAPATAPQVAQQVRGNPLRRKESAPPRSSQSSMARGRVQQLAITAASSSSR